MKSLCSGKTSSILIFIFCLLVPSIAAQQVDEIIAKSIEARGGLNRLKSVQSIESVGTISMHGIISPLTTRIKRPGNLRMDLTIQGQSISQATDGETAWHIMPFMALLSKLAIREVGSTS